MRRKSVADTCAYSSGAIEAVSVPPAFAVRQRSRSMTAVTKLEILRAA